MMSVLKVASDTDTECGRRYAFGCMVAIRGGYRMARGWHYAKLSLSRALLLYFFWQVYFVIGPFFLSFLFRFVMFSSALVGAL